MTLTPRPWLLRGILLCVLIGSIGAGCGDDNGTSPEQAGDSFQSIIDQFDLDPLPAISYPPNNTFNAERIALGKLLFFDPILGGESAPWIKEAAGRDPFRDRANDVACATCHLPQFAFADGRRLGAGVGGAQLNDLDLGPFRVVPATSLVTGDDVGTEPRNSQSILNSAFNGLDSNVPRFESFMFMDGRVTHGLEEQAGKPITSRDEMAGDAYGRPDLGPLLTAPMIQDSVVNRIRGISGYLERFRQAFAGEVEVAADIELDHVTRAIAAYERELITPDSRYDRFVAGDRSAFSATEKRGFELFFTKGRCGACHNGPMLSNFTFRVQGVGDEYDSILPGFGGKNGSGGDFGRFHADEQAFAELKFAFRVLTVRNVELSAPYFHSGSAGTLREVVEFYNRGGLGPQDISNATLAAAGATRDPDITPLDLTEGEIDAIVAFLKTTTAPVQRGPLGVDLVETPRRVPSGLLPPGVPTPAAKSGPFWPEGDMP